MFAKIKIELIVDDTGNSYLNYWNWWNGEDVVCEVKDGKIIDDNGDGKEITIQEFIDRVKEKVKAQP